MEKAIKNLKNAKIYYQDKIIEVRFKENAAVELEDAKEIVTAIGEAVRGEKHGLMINAEKMSFINREARSYFGAQKGKAAVANAIVVKNSLQKSFANMYLKFASPALPTRMFTDKEEGMKWLEEKMG